MILTRSHATNINQGSHVYLMGKMIDSGVLKSFLDDNCQTNKYIPYPDTIRPDQRCEDRL